MAAITALQVLETVRRIEAHGALETAHCAFKSFFANPQ